MTNQSNIKSDPCNALYIGPDDVLLGRGGATNNHLGNHNFRLLVAAHQQEYLKARKHEKVIIARRIVAEVQGRGGRFLQKGMSNDQWDEVSDKRAQEKTSQALREGLDVRNNRVRPNKLIKALRRGSESSAVNITSTNTTLSNASVITPKISPVNQSASTNYRTIGQPNRLDIPTFNDELAEPPFLSYQLPLINKQELKHACEV
jgi:HD superfamily phosphohydrolase